jgi:hypothetical protein
VLCFFMHCLGSLSVLVKVAKFWPPGFMWDVPGSNVVGVHLSENEVFRRLRKIAKSAY